MNCWKCGVFIPWPTSAGMPCAYEVFCGRCGRPAPGEHLFFGHAECGMYDCGWDDYHACKYDNKPPPDALV
jgi:hypothetical protein